MDNNIALIGLGPHAKRIYLKYFKENNSNFVLLIELESKVKKSISYLKENGINNINIFALPDKFKDFENMPIEFYNKLKKKCNKLKINKIIVSTEPKAHNMYLKFALENNIDILSDKPITVVKGMEKLENIEKIRRQYYELLDLYNNSSSQCKIMCQRLYHKGYTYIKKLLTQIVKKYNVPITYIDIYHCDGNWEMPHDLNKENHPYKYGYGKLYHSGFHFIDLTAELLKINQNTTPDKHISLGKLYGNIFTPNDEKNIFNKKDFYNIFPESKQNGFYKKMDKMNFNNYGEKNFYSQLSFYNNNKSLITTINLNLLHYGFSRRGWFKSRDYYKKNGRVRHEKITINVGPLINIQVTSCQSKQIEERTNSKCEIMAGGLEHFDIEIYRNVDIIGGKPYEKIKLIDLYKNEIKNNKFIGFNEKSREDYITSFLNSSSNIGNIKNEKQAIEILFSASKVLYNKYNNIDEVININIPKEE